MLEPETSAVELAASSVTLAEMTTELVASYVSRNRVQPADMPALIATVHASLASLGREPEGVALPAKLTPSVPIRKTMTDAHIISLEDGKPYQSLKRHLAKHGLTPAEYRTKWGLPVDYPMVAPAYARKRSELAKSIGLGSLRRKG